MGVNDPIKDVGVGLGTSCPYCEKRPCICKKGVCAGFSSGSVRFVIDNCGYQAALAAGPVISEWFVNIPGPMTLLLNNVHIVGAQVKLNGVEVTANYSLAQTVAAPLGLAASLSRAGSSPAAAQKR